MLFCQCTSGKSRSHKVLQTFILSIASCKIRRSTTFLKTRINSWQTFLSLILYTLLLQFDYFCFLFWTKNFNPQKMGLIFQTEHITLVHTLTKKNEQTKQHLKFTYISNSNIKTSSGFIRLIQNRENKSNFTIHTEAGVNFIEDGIVSPKIIWLLTTCCPFHSSPFQERRSYQSLYRI